ncbi:hypothetical protein BBO99_00001208 [Phytophthora kernoviae]|uniref:Uncharacterized protein n=2 Tax=Phytophthora kernoviae TaxID=325452 RepID=A0A3R7MSX6_9STRA|nr:hypothetical protein G195_002964 [Phytophthora kernoviae 00238/432]KAG2526286.1 hypothetical protein JM16_002072 [Phytophthora kernoviae]KAG2527827.1 hypothetical protein JM18_002177 [Phytophthora kernoviae]RLN32242.1 hypothetical protein BBI17_004352 [Phytophthora kernoviae]RLN84556.1 hypothetical protein BBO99_00001208 [Phytophthora kernoviae]
MTDGIICGVCRAPVDARGLIASRKEAKRQDFEKKESRFVQSGCYINPFGSKEYTRFVYIKHTRAVEKARAQKRKRAEHEAQEHRERERKRISLEAEQALKSQMLAMRNKQRQHLKATSSKQTT